MEDRLARNDAIFDSRSSILDPLRFLMFSTSFKAKSQ